VVEKAKSQEGEMYFRNSALGGRPTQSEG